MPNFTRFLEMHIGLKNTLASKVAERVHSIHDLGDGKMLRRCSITETVAINGATVNMTTQIPAGARILFGSRRNSGAVVLTTAVKLGVGVGSTPSAILLSSTVMTDGASNDAAVADAAAVRTTAATTVVITAVDTSGAAAGTAVGSIKVRVVYEYVDALAA